MKRTKEDIRKENIRFIAKCIGWFLAILIFCPGIISFGVGATIGLTFYGFIAKHFM